MSERNAVDVSSLLADGKKFLLLCETQKAVSCFQEAAKQLDAVYGQGANECGEAYLYYGKSMLQLARMEMGVFGSGIPGGEERNEKEASGSEEEDVEDTNEEGEEETKEEGEDETKEEGEDETKEEEKSDVTKDEDHVAESSKADDGAVDALPGCGDEMEEVNADRTGSSKMDENQVEQSDQTTDSETLQIAWETLELARIVFSRQSGQEHKLNEAEAHLRLAEVGLETGQYDQAVGDIQQCLALQSSVLEPDDRRLAETYYSLALALAQAERFDDAVGEFKHASQVLNMRIANIKQKLQATGEPTADNNNEKDRQELSDLEAILPDIQTKIEDLEDSKQALKQLAAEALGLNVGLHAGSSSKSETDQQSGQGAAAATMPSELKMVNDISHLVKRKRKAPAEEPETKRARSED